MQIAATTRISTLIKENPAAIDAIASISSHFEKLRNPFLRKVLASRVTIADAARIGGCRVEQFYEKLVPLGFTVGSATAPAFAKPKPVATAPEPVELPENGLVELDVRVDIAAGNDPFRKIMKAVEELEEEHTLVLINTFEPTPLLTILQKRGFNYHVVEKEEKLVYTYFWHKTALAAAPETSAPLNTSFDIIQTSFADNIRQVDVRHLEMPQPMVTILSELATLPAGTALHVKHRRVPQYLLPQLQERGFLIAIKEVSPSETDLLIYR
ncbi:DUF2249 domain-containing protein [Pontibacter qinzhouensis]|uniref:DUF2249 domain-containing protein n=1 Tax=Pontibacter qinzhouensis TaxID=2603253 RepID=A0A5C8J5N5_9BACT|nr:DUF2249 domain-containing protein [Pontibacter qinzhouensis]TXK32812.1 DUF2249 domain-containing protein [Pontibacter qinzhouensis]